MNGVLVEDFQVPRAKGTREEASLTASHRQGELIKLMVKFHVFTSIYEAHCCCVSRGRVRALHARKPIQSVHSTRERILNSVPGTDDTNESSVLRREAM